MHFYIKTEVVVEIKTRSVVRKGASLAPVDIYGYSTNGVPGLDIVGMGGEGKIIKEKFIFLTRSEKLRVPLKRFVIGVEFNNLSKKCAENSLDILEVPMLILYWALAGYLQIRNLENCWSTGKVTVDFQFNCPLLGDLENYFMSISQERQDACLILPEERRAGIDLRSISLESLFEQAKLLRSENQDGEGILRIAQL